MSWNLIAQPVDPFAINRIYLGGDGHPRVEFTSREDSYYILYQGDSLNEITLPRDLKLGADDSLELADDSTPPPTGARFYRVRQFSRTAAETLDVAARNGLSVSANRTAGGVIIFRDNEETGPGLRIVGQVDTPGDACRLALSGRYLVVALGWGGLLIIDLENPARARVRHHLRFGLRACAVTASEETAYVAFATGQLVAVDLITGAVTHRVKLPEPAWDIAVAGEVLYALGDTKLCVLPLRPPGLQVAQVVAAAQAGRGHRMFVGSRLIYAPFGAGFNRFDLSNPLEPVALPPVHSPQQNWRFVIGNGTGLALAGIEDPSLGLGQSLRLLDVGEDGLQSTLLQSFGSASWNRTATIYRGRAHLAGGPGGLQVLQFLAPDAAGIAPTIQLITPAFQDGVECGQPLYLRAQTSDDVQVREVEFHVNGEQVASVGGYPFEHRWRVPNHLASQFLQVRARVFDTGGNGVWSDEHNVALRPDRTPPQAVVSLPKFNLIIGRPSVLKVCFNEAVLASTIIKSRFRLIHAGPDDRPGTTDDFEITQFEVSLAEDGRTVSLVFSGPLPVGRCRLRVEPGVSDPAGNVCPTMYETAFAILDGVDSDDDGLPDDVELALGLDPNNPDSGGNDVPDGLKDTDNDGLNNVEELLLGTNPSEPDTSGNGKTDGLEDSDFDGVSNQEEFQSGLNPLLADTDGDGWHDGVELEMGSDAKDPSSRPSVPAYARPPTKVLRPSTVLPAGSTLGAVMAQPPVKVLRPSVVLPAGASVGAAMAQPPTTVLRSVSTLGEGLEPGAVIASPPVRINTNLE